MVPIQKCPLQNTRMTPLPNQFNPLKFKEYDVEKYLAHLSPCLFLRIVHFHRHETSPDLRQPVDVFDMIRFFTLEAEYSEQETKINITQMNYETFTEQTDSQNGT